MNYLNIYKKYSLSIHIVFFTILFFLMNVFFRIGFAENDDTVMALIASGKYGGAPDNHLVFINMIYGTFLNIFYYLFPSIEWYTIMIIFLNLLSTSLISWRIVESHQSKHVKAVFLLFLIMVSVYINVHMQFTVTAGVLAIAGVMFLNEPLKRLKYIGVACFVLGSLIRFEAAFLVLIITAPIFMIETIKRKKVYFDTKTKFLIVAVIISLGSKAIDYAYYNANDEWSYFQKFNKIRGEINDNPNTRMVLYGLPETVSKEDYESILSFFINQKLINYDILKDLHKAVNNVPSFTKIRNLYFLRYYSFPIFLIMIFVLIVNYSSKIKKSEKNIISLLSFVFVGILCFIAFNAMVKYRVFFTAITALVFGLFMVVPRISFVNVKRMLLVVVLLITGYLYEAFSQTYIDKQFLQQVYGVQKENIDQYLQNNNKKLVVYGGDYQIFGGDPFTISKDFPEDRIFFNGWLTYIPFNENRFDSFKYFTKDHGLIVLRRNYEQALNQVQKGILSETGKTVTPKITHESLFGFIVEFSEDKAR